MERVHVFIDGMAFRINNRNNAVPTKDLLDKVCAKTGGTYTGATFYIGVSPETATWELTNTYLNQIMTVQGLVVKRFPQKKKFVKCSCGNVQSHLTEKEVDTTIALDMYAGAISNQYDTAILYTIDSDMRPILVKLRELGKKCYIVANKLNDIPTELKGYSYDYFTIQSLETSINVDLARAVLSLIKSGNSVVYASYFFRELEKRGVYKTDGLDLIKLLEENGNLIQKKDSSGDTFFLLGDI